MRIAIYIHQEGWWHKMGCLLSLFVQHKTVGVPDQWSVVCVEKHLVWKLYEDQEKETG